MSIKTLDTREVYRNPWLRVREDRIQRNNGVEGIYGVVDKEDCAIIIPLDDDHVYLVEQFRYTVQQRLLEFPQGGWETKDVDPEELARGELKEETGLAARTMKFLGTTYVAYGFVNQKMHIYLATGLTQTTQEPDPEEHDLQLHRVPVREFEAMLRDGRIPDICTIAAWGMYRLKDDFCSRNV
jgi:8-oxo-dGTP pyrophosphatase MutT (NUDIX family)